MTARHPAADTDGTAPDRTAVVLARLAKAGYARRFEARNGHLWCPSCEVSLAGHNLLVGEIVDVQGVEGAGRAYALRCEACGAAGVWVVIRPAQEDLQIIDTFQAAPRSVRRPD
jgi:hypothetical protein